MEQNVYVDANKSEQYCPENIFVPLKDILPLVSPPVIVAASDPPDIHKKIPKPTSDVTRLSRDGYSLDKALGWDQEHYRAVQVSPCSPCDTSCHQTVDA
jgi:hypothetical protein